MNFEVRKAKVEDAEDLKQLNYEFNDVIVTKDNIIDGIKAGEEIIVVAIVNNSPAAFACAKITKSICYNYKDAEITEVFVRENYRNQGIAKAMIKFIENVFKENNANHIGILTGTKNFAAQALYRNCGYARKEKVMIVKYLHEEEH
ncbi:GNAT family N-acetyltransferase [Clostridium sp.]|uniref:GNAT family N-acetyltransferase n=1 Tax=Clostridium sp. TaxID=1506 RepID=UPI003217235B